ncbi:SPFH domain, Band 7 family protein [Methanocella conradii HZ254]|uniref:SPFH domain, Band 7 family protein n=1 Tax=Methanocella conradii (strain DSM 24694 / JCM 17849 / CGMCC 1.5162 / HZ254) TaxID=1041930 RepID=H8I8Q4_METCZ|nr:SPFH domain-containing protein [Methanocella conradii]AFC99958.1 SPFH domain, Band 7 family protein [Methanocella conradii HZ254]MDI6897303.1 SPFH domain-containing protein [Methanocella conradii]
MLLQVGIGFEVLFVLITLFVIGAVILILVSGIRIIQPYQQGLWILLGQYRGRLNPGFNWVFPLVSNVIKMDLRTQVLDIPKQEVITKDNSPTNVDAIVYIKVVDPEKAYFEVTNYRIATIALAQTTLRSVIGDMELDEILYNRDLINGKLRDILDKATDAWGVRVEAVEIREVDPVGPVKAAMEEQTSAERRRRAAILLADGNKRSAILEAEGAKQAMILKAEGTRQSRILEAEGARVSSILQAQGQAQALRLISLGAVPLDKKALTVLSLDTLAKMSSGQATKIIFPFEISKLIEQSAKYLGASEEKVPEVGAATDVERIVGKPEDVLGKIPNPDELRAEVADIEKQLKKDLEDTAKTTKDLKKMPGEDKPSDVLENAKK